MPDYCAGGTWCNVGIAAGLAHTRLPPLRVACQTGVGSSWLRISLEWTAGKEVTCLTADRLASPPVAAAAYPPPQMFGCVFHGFVPGGLHVLVGASAPAQGVCSTSSGVRPQASVVRSADEPGAAARAVVHAGIRRGQRQQGQQRAGRAGRRRAVPLQGLAARHELHLRPAEGVRQVRRGVDAAGVGRLPQRLLREVVRQVPVAVPVRSARVWHGPEAPSSVGRTAAVLRAGGRRVSYLGHAYLCWAQAGRTSPPAPFQCVLLWSFGRHKAGARVRRALVCLGSTARFDAYARAGRRRSGGPCTTFHRAPQPLAGGVVSTMFGTRMCDRGGACFGATAAGGSAGA